MYDVQQYPKRPRCAGGRLTSREQPVQYSIVETGLREQPLHERCHELQQREFVLLPKTALSSS